MNKKFNISKSLLNINYYCPLYKLCKDLGQYAQLCGESGNIYVKPRKLCDFEKAI